MEIAKVLLLILAFTISALACNWQDYEAIDVKEGPKLGCETFLLKWLKHSKAQGDKFTVFLLDSRSNRRELCLPVSLFSGPCGWWVTLLFKYLKSKSGEKYLSKKGDEYCGQSSDDPKICKSDVDSYLKKMKKLADRYEKRKFADEYCKTMQ